MSIIKIEIKKLLSRSGIVFFCRVAGAFITFISQILMARWMGAEQLGIYVYSFSIAMLLSTIASLGLPAASLQFISQYLASNKTSFINGYLRYSRKVIAFSSLVVVLISCIYLIIISISLNIIPLSIQENGASLKIEMFIENSMSNYFMPVLIGILCIPVIAFFRFHDRVAHAFSWFTLSFLPSMTLRPLFFLIVLYSVWITTGGLTAKSAMIIQFIIIFVISILHLLRLRSKIKNRVNNNQYQYACSMWVRASIPLLLITVFTQYFPELSIIMIGGDLEPEKLAIFNASYRTALLIGFVSNSISAAIVPKASQFHASGDKEGLQYYIRKASQLNFLIATIGIIFFALYGKFILQLFGEQFISGYPSLLILAAAQLFLAGIGPVAILLNITGHQNQCLFAFGVSIIIGVILEYYLVQYYGLIGAGGMVFLVSVFWSIWLHFLVKRFLGIHSSIFSFFVVRN